MLQHVLQRQLTHSVATNEKEQGTRQEPNIFEEQHTYPTQVNVQSVTL